MLTQTRLDDLWDFGAPATSEARLREAAGSAMGTERHELRTQVARALGMQDRFDEGHAELDDLPCEEPVLVARVALERGRLEGGAGSADAAISRFLEAVGSARAHGLTYLEVDALHALALADRDRAEQWTLRALSCVDGTSDPRTRRWAVSLHSDLGWALHDAGRFDRALVEFSRALAAAEMYGTEEQRRSARWALGRCLRSLGRTGEARAIQLELASEDPSATHVRTELALLGG